MHEDVFAFLDGFQKLSVVLHQPGLLGNVLYAQVEKLALALAGQETDPARTPELSSGTVDILGTGRA